MSAGAIAELLRGYAAQQKRIARIAVICRTLAEEIEQMLDCEQPETAWRKRKGLITDEESQQIVALRKEGKTWHQIAAEVGRGVSTVQRCAIKHGFPRRNRTSKLTHEIVNRIKKMRQSGSTYEAISNAVGCATTTARQAVDGVYDNSKPKTARRRGNQPHITDEEVQQIAALRQDGKTLQETADAVGRALSTVQRIARKAGVPRGKGGRPRKPR